MNFSNEQDCSGLHRPDQSRWDFQGCHDSPLQVQLHVWQVPCSLPQSAQLAGQPTQPAHNPPSTSVLCMIQHISVCHLTLQKRQAQTQSQSRCSLLRRMLGAWPGVNAVTPREKMHACSHVAVLQVAKRPTKGEATRCFALRMK